ncbi:MAG: FAD-binding protein [Candidatus Lokiarchaeota archaeon]|nr:FAD-binding protein [Candidatus Lokiarchaeota archaeon]
MKLLEPIMVNKVEFRTHTLMPAMHTGMVKGLGEITDTFTNFYLERAKSNVGLIIVGGCRIGPLTAPLNMIALDEDKYIPQLGEFTSKMHKFGAPVAAQLYHGGAYVHSFSLLPEVKQKGGKALAPSAIYSKFTKETPKEMTIEEIKTAINEFATAAHRAKEAGFDGVEIIGSAGYLISQFLSPLKNKRTDEYGGSLENRMRFMHEVAKAVRDKVGKDFLIIYRAAGDDFVSGSNTYKDVAVIMKSLAEGGQVDLINVTGGWHETGIPQLTMVVPRAGYVYLGENIKNAVAGTGVLVSMANRINDPSLAESILQQEKVDIIVLGRALISDPEFLIKAREGRDRDIRKCLACNQGCFDAVFSAQPITCTVNAMVGYEEKRQITSAEQKKKVAVIGGGPAGLEAARVCRLRGHDVTLYEKTDRLGGALHWAAAPPGRKEFYDLIKWYEHMMRKLNVNVVLNQDIDLDVLQEQKFDAVIAATGSKPIELNIPGMKKNDPRIVHAYDILENKKHAGKRVVVIGGSGVGLDVGLYLAEQGGLNAEQAMFLMQWQALSPEDALQLKLRTRKITVIEMLPSLGKGIGQTTRWTILKDLAMHGVEMVTKTKAIEITEKPFGVLVEKEGKQEFIEADTIVMAVGVKPDKETFDKLKANLPKNIEVLKIGDAKKARTALEAVADGFKAALKI